MAKRDVFTAGGLRIETWRENDHRVFVAWKPHVSLYLDNRKELLRFVAWPPKTPTGDSLRSWLTSLEAMDAERKKPASLEQEQALLKETGWGPEAHAEEDEDPSANCKMIT